MSFLASIPYGIDKDGELVLASEVPSAKYGKRCDLRCPECGTPLLAVRYSQDPGSAIRFFRHESNSNCPGASESTMHKLAKKLFSDGVGETFMLPHVTAYDALPHVSRYTSSGNKRFDDFSEEKTFESMLDEIELINPVSAKIVGVSEETVVCGTGKTADIVLALEIKGKTASIPVEIRNTHAKDIEDVRKYAEAKSSVIEIFVGDIDDLADEDDVEQLRCRLFGKDGDYGREYLFNAKAKSIADARYALKVQMSHLTYRGSMLCHDCVERYSPFFDRRIQNPFSSAVSKVLPRSSYQFSCQEVFEETCLSQYRHVEIPYLIGDKSFPSRGGWRNEDYWVHAMFIIVDKDDNTRASQLSVCDINRVHKLIETAADQSYTSLS